MQGLRKRLRGIARFMLVLAIARVAAGVAIIAFADRDAAAWSIELTVIVLVAAVVYLSAALAVRWWSSPRAAR